MLSTLSSLKGVGRKPYIVSTDKQLADELFAMTNMYEVNAS